MSKKNIINLLSFIILIALALFILIQNKKTTTLDESDSDFSISDTASISKIFIADMQGQEVTLIRKNEKWLINDSFAANPARIDNIMQLLPRLEVKGIVPASAKDQVIRTMAANSVKVEFYANDNKPFKTIYVGGPTTDQEGTYMAIDRKKKGKTPYIVHDPTFRGYLSDGYFYCDINEWRSKKIFPIKATKIRTVRVEYTDSAIYNFELKVSKNLSSFTVKGMNGAMPQEVIDPARVKKYLSSFSAITYINLETDLVPRQVDSFLHSKPFCRIFVQDEDQNVYKLRLFYKPSDLRTRVEIMKGYDKERYFGEASIRKGDLLIFQSLLLTRIMWKFDHFKKEN